MLARSNAIEPVGEEFWEKLDNVVFCSCERGQVSLLTSKGSYFTKCFAKHLTRNPGQNVKETLGAVKDYFGKKGIPMNIYFE